MTPVTYLWIEDRKGKSGYMFWKTFMQQLFPSVVVESKKNNSELVKAVSGLQDSENRYIILFDNSFDNVQIYQEQKRLQQCVSLKKNVMLVDIICFEYLLLEFDSLIDWVFASEDNLRETRSLAISARNKLVKLIASGDLNYKFLKELVIYDKHLEQHNIEQLAAKLLFDITRNTGFEVSKGRIGECWIKSCCEWSGREENDICGLDKTQLSVFKKMNLIYTKTSLCKKLSQADLEVTVC